jgi:hypothetical protein
MSKVLYFAGVVTVLMSLAWQVEAAELSLICPCEAERVGQTAVKITAGIRNTGDTESGELRIYLGSVSSLPIDSGYYRAFSYFPETLNPGWQYSAGAEATVALRLPDEQEVDSAGRAHLLLRLEEKVDGVWSFREEVRLAPMVTFPAPEQGGESPRFGLFFDGKPSFEVNGDQATLRIPKVVNSSLEAVTISRVVLGHSSSAEFWSVPYRLGFNGDNLSITIEPLSSLTGVEITGDYTGPSTNDPFTHLSLRSEDGGVEVWETIEAREGNAISTYPFTAESFDFLADSDDDGVSDFNEELVGTEPDDAASQPGTVVIDVMALYTPAVDETYNGEPAARILHELEWANQAFQNSNINARFRLVKTKSVNHEGLELQTALNAVQDQSGVFEGIDAVRQDAGADLLVLYLEDDPDDDDCGLGTLSGEGGDGDIAALIGRSQIVTTVAAGCRTRTLTHEFGHNLGLGHDARNENNVGTFNWSRGHGVDDSFVTTMAYSSGYNYYGPDLQYFSNPLIDCLGGLPCGVDKSNTELGADAALSIRTTMFQIADLSGPPPDFDGDGIIDFEDPDDDNDGVGDDSDAFPYNIDETADTDGDGIGDNADVFPEDAYEWADADGDGIGDNADINVDVCMDTEVNGPRASESALPIETRLMTVNPGSNENQQAFLRFVNPSSEAAQVELYGIDDSGLASRRPPVSFTLAPNEAKQMTAQDLENGNADKGLESTLCDGTGKWQIIARSSEALEMMSLIRTRDGFLAGLTDPVPVEEGANIVYFANPASTTEQQTFLRIVNNTSTGGTVTITGVDNEGVTAPETVTFELAGDAAKQMTAQDLELGNPDKGLAGKLGEGNGRWRLVIASTLSISAQSLIRTPDGFLVNVSMPVTPNETGSSTVSFFNPASNTEQQSFIRLVNTDAQSTAVTISGVDDAGQMAPNGDVSLTLAAGHSVELSAADLEEGNSVLQLLGSLGTGSGRWRLHVASDSAVSVVSYVLTSEGFLTNMSSVVGAASTSNTVWIFNPGSNANQVSKLRVINSGLSSAAVTVTGIDDAGNASPGTDLTFNLSAGSVKEVMAAELENGSAEKGLAGGIGDGQGKWRLTVTADEPVAVQSLLETPLGFITNLSTSAGMPE